VSRRSILGWKRVWCVPPERVTLRMRASLLVVAHVAKATERRRIAPASEKIDPQEALPHGIARLWKDPSFLCCALSLLVAFQQNNGDLACDLRGKLSESRELL
jgi:hypothetical protein